MKHLIPLVIYRSIYVPYFAQGRHITLHLLSPISLSESPEHLNQVVNTDQPITYGHTLNDSISNLMTTISKSAYLSCQSSLKIPL
jgi:hypothetical protein